MKYIFFLLLLIQIQHVFSQENIELETFLQEIETIKEVDSSIVYLKNSLKNTKNERILLEANFTLGQIYKKKKNNYSLSKKYLHRAAVIAEKNNNKEKLANIYMNQGFNFYQKKSDSALYYYRKALDFSKQIKSDLLISKIYSNIARLYVKEDDTISAIKSYHKSISIGKKVDRNLCTVYNNFGSFYSNVNRDSAIYYHQKSLKIAKKKFSKRKELRSYVNLGITYLEDSDYYEDAYKNLIKAEEIAKELKGTKSLYYINFFLGKYYQLKHKSDKAENYYQLVLDSNFPKQEINLRIQVYKQLSGFYEDLGNYKKAFFFLKKHHDLNDSIYSQDKSKDYNSMKTKFEVAEKDNRITLLTKQKEIEETKRKYIILVSIVILLFLLFLTYLLRNRIKNQKRLREKEHEFFLQEIKTKKALSLIEGQEKERNRLSKELHDGLGGQLSGIKSMLQAVTINNFIEKKEDIDVYLSSSIKNLRNISHDLSGKFLQDNDFDTLIHQLISRAFETTKTKIEISIFPKEKINLLPKHYKLNMYRIIQEAIQNIIKHANATYVSISLLYSNVEVNILIEDNGVGFNIKNKPKGIGLQNIKERLQSIDGSLYIDSKLQKGTTLNINIPIHD